MDDPETVYQALTDFQNADLTLGDRLTFELPPEDVPPAELAAIARDVMWRSQSCAEFFQSLADELSEELGE